MKVICIDNSVNSSPSSKIERHLYLSLLEVGKEYDVYEVIETKNWTGYRLVGIPDEGRGFISTRFVVCDSGPVEEVAGELCN